MKKSFNTPFLELTSILTFLADEKRITQKAIGEKLGVSESQIVKLRQGKSRTKTEHYLNIIKDKYRNDLLPFYEDLPAATNEVILRELLEVKREILDLKKTMNKI